MIQKLLLFIKDAAFTYVQKVTVITIELIKQHSLEKKGLLKSPTKINFLGNFLLRSQSNEKFFFWV